MWSKRRKSEAELTGDDSISQIPGVGARYVSRLQLHGVSTIGQFASMAATECRC
jgi:predicted flap endonuclease-1-like 5' DNA nuclease